jgi:hypothetical protein
VTSIDVTAFEECDAIKYASMNSDGAKALSRANYLFCIPDGNFGLIYSLNSDDTITPESVKFDNLQTFQRPATTAI